MPRFWTRLVDSLPRDMKSLTWRLPLVVVVVILSIMIFYPFQDTPYAEEVVVDTYEVAKGGGLGKIDLNAREVKSYAVTSRLVWLTSPFHYEIERELASEKLPPSGGRPRRERTLQIRSRGLNLGLDLRGGTELLYKILLADETKQSVTAEEIKTIIQTRIDAYGLREPRIQVQGGDRIQVQLPGQEAADLETIKSVIQNVGHLEFRLVASSTSEAYRKWQESGQAPPLYTDYSLPSLTEEKQEREKVLISDTPLMTGEPIRGTRVITGGTELRPTVGLSFSPQGQQDFARITGEHVKERLAIVLNTRRSAEGKIIEKGICYSAPVIEERIYGDAVIRGDFDVTEARALRTVLMAGSLPAPLRLESENTVGATLGPALVSKGIRAIVVGIIAVVLFMGVYYLFAGLVANFALLLNILIIVSVLILFDATLTMPGIAGLLLTVGMSVDANVLIFERIREEKAGPTDKPLRLAIRDGYGRAFWTIFDSNLTTLLTAYILYWVGTGTVKGFAIVLAIGILASMFTALVVTRVIFDVLTWRRLISRLPMAQLFKRPHIAFMSLRNKFLLASGILIVAGLTVFASRGSDNWDIDFNGGTLIHMVFHKPMDAADIRQRLQAAGPEFAEVEVQSIAAAAEEGVGREAREFVIRIPSLSELVVRSIEPITTRAKEGITVDVTTVAPLKLEDVQAALTAYKLTGYTVSSAGQADPEGKLSAFQVKAPVLDAREVRTKLETALASLKPANAREILASFKAGEPVVDFRFQVKVEIDRPIPLAEIARALSAEGGHWKVEPTSKEEGQGRYRAFTIDSDLSTARIATDRIEHAFDTQTLTAEVEGIFKQDLAPRGIEKLGTRDDRALLAMNLTRPITLDTVETNLAAWNIEAKATGDPASAAHSGFTRFDVSVVSTQADSLVDHVRDDSRTFPLSEPIPRVVKVGPAVAQEMLVWAVVAIAAASLVIIAYVWLRFERFKYGLAAVIALIHDVLITVGMLAVFGYKFNLPIVAAILTIIGYSINDTIVVFDRIRENLRKQRKRDVDMDTIDTSVNQTLSRTVLTSATTLIAVLALFIFAGGVIQDFAFALLIGIVVGTYSSVFIASPILILHQEHIEKRLSRGRAATT